MGLWYMKGAGSRRAGSRGQPGGVTTTLVIKQDLSFHLIKIKKEKKKSSPVNSKTQSCQGRRRLPPGTLRKPGLLFK